MLLFYRTTSPDMSNYIQNPISHILSKALIIVLLICLPQAAVAIADAQPDNSATALKASTTEEKPTVNWLIWELAPEFIRSGDYAGKGYADQFLAYFKKAFPEYQHRNHWVSIKRWRHELKNDYTCTPHVWSGFGEGFLHYSKPYTLTPPMGILAHRRNQRRLGEPGSIISLQKILAVEDLTLIILPLMSGTDNRQSRYPHLDQYLQPYIGKKNLYELSYGANEVNLKMLDRDRAQYTLTYPTTAATNVKIKGIENSYVFYNIEEYPYYKKIYVACRDSEFGRKMVKKSIK